jgi:Tol biopolymer transport system component
VAFCWFGEKGDNYDIYVKVIGELQVLRLTTDPAMDTARAWSPDGRQIAFCREGNAGVSGVYLVSSLGGRARKLPDVRWDAPIRGRGLSWMPDGKWIAVALPRSTAVTAGDTSGIYLIPADGGDRRQITGPSVPLRMSCLQSLRREGLLLLRGVLLPMSATFIARNWFRTARRTANRAD